MRDMLFLFIKFPCHFCTEMMWCNQLKMPRKQEGESMWCHWWKINCRSDAPKAHPGRCLSMLCQKLEIKRQSVRLNDGFGVIVIYVVDTTNHRGSNWKVKYLNACQVKIRNIQNCRDERWMTFQDIVNVKKMNFWKPNGSKIRVRVLVFDMWKFSKMKIM